MSHYCPYPACFHWLGLPLQHDDIVVRDCWIISPWSSTQHTYQVLPNGLGSSSLALWLGGSITSNYYLLPTKPTRRGHMSSLLLPSYIKSTNRVIYFNSGTSTLADHSPLLSLPSLRQSWALILYFWCSRAIVVLFVFQEGHVGYTSNTSIHHL